METPNEIGQRIAWHELTYKSNGVNEPDIVDTDALAALIAAAIRNVYEWCAMRAHLGGDPDRITADFLRLRDGEQPADEGRAARFWAESMTEDRIRYYKENER